MTEKLDIVDIIEARNGGNHAVRFRGDQDRKGVADRWSWSCRCGSVSKRVDLTLAEAQVDWEQLHGFGR